MLLRLLVGCLLAYSAGFAVSKERSEPIEALDAISPRNSGFYYGGSTAAHIPFVGEGEVSSIPLSLHQAIKLAVSWHPSIQEAVGALYQQGEEIKTAEAGYYPKIDGGFKGGSNLSGLGDASISVSQMLYDFGKVASEVDGARASARRSQAELLLAVDQVTQDTAHAVIEVQRYQSLSKQALEQVDGMTRIADLAQKRSDLGASPRSDLLEAVSRVEWSQATLEHYVAQHRRWNSVLANLLGKTQHFDIKQSFPSYLTQSCKRIDLKSIQFVPELLVAEAKRLEALALVDKTRAQGLPTISLDPTLRHDLKHKSRADVYINFEMPLYEGGAIKSRRSSAKYALSSAEAAKATALLSVRQGLYEARDQVFSLERRLESLDMRRQSIQQTRDLYQRQYIELGNRRLTDLLGAEQQIHQARFDYEDTKADLQKLYIDCLYYSGQLRSSFGLEDQKVQGVVIRP